MRTVVGDRLQVRGRIVGASDQRSEVIESEDETAHRGISSATMTDMKASFSLVRTHRSGTGRRASRRPDVKGAAYVTREHRQIL